MAKVYPDINVSESMLFYRYVFGVKQPPLKQEVFSFKRNTISDVTPGFPFKIQENGFRSQLTRNEWTVGSIDTYDWMNRLTRNFEVVHCPVIAVPTAVRNRVRYKALLRMYDEIPTATSNLALLYAERKKTMEGLLVALGGILKCVRQVRKGKVPELFMNASELKTRKKYTGAWLNYTYGIKPFMSDIYGIASMDPLKQVVWVSGTAESNDEYSGPAYTASGKYREKHKFGLSLSDPLVASMAQTGMTNPALIAWELTPFSFMADWLLPVGPYLEMLSSTSGYTKHNGSVTTGWNYQGNAWSDRSGAQHRTKFRLIERTIQSFPAPPLPRFKNPISPVHALNTLSIIHQLVKPRK